MDNSWIDTYMQKCEDKYEISKLGEKLFLAIGLKSDDPRFIELGKILLEHFLHLEAKKE